MRHALSGNGTHDTMRALGRELRQRLPTPVKRAVRGIYNVVLDLAEGALGLRDDLTPPRRMIFVGDGDFKKVGQEFLSYFVELGRLQRDARVLDVGSGIGRMAVPLTGYLSPEGEYWGIDIVRDGIQWCIDHIAPRFPNFHFQHADVFNGLYNPGGGLRARDYRFPFADQYFDFVFLTSVFTHMLPADLRNYLSEISRVLRPRGNAVVTFFLLNSESRALVAAGESRLSFRYAVEGCLTVDAQNPESAVAYDEGAVRALFSQHGFELEEPIRFGSWCGRKSYLSFQDIVLARMARR